MDLQVVFDKLMHNGLNTYKTKGSMAPLPARIKAEKEDKLNKKGAVFAVRSKDNFLGDGVKGFIITSKESLVDQANKLTHFTPNVYGKFSYSNEKRTKIQGFEESNLNQINTFVVDIDTKEHTIQEILVECMDSSVGAPTMILETDNGFQVFFVLASPFYISSRNDFRGLKVAKRISDNIKRSLSNVDADVYCNDFGFFRIPKKDNIVWFQEQYTYTVSDLIDWSIRQDDDFGRSLYVVQKQELDTVQKATESEWFHALLSAVDVRGNKGQIGRNNMLYTLALICYAEGKSQDDTFDLLDMYNSNLHYPVKHAEVNAVIRSAYNGKRTGASKDYVQDLLATYVTGGADMCVSFGRSVWYKFKKERADRVRSHLHEWEDDILNYINECCTSLNPFVELTQKELCEEIGIANSSLNKLMKQSTKLVKRVRGFGRTAVTSWSTAELLVQHVLTLIQDRHNATQEQVQHLIKTVMIKVVVNPGKQKTLATLEKLVVDGFPRARSARGRGFG